MLRSGDQRRDPGHQPVHALWRHQQGAAPVLHRRGSTGAGRADLWGLLRRAFRPGGPRRVRGAHGDRSGGWRAGDLGAAPRGRRQPL